MFDDAPIIDAVEHVEDVNLHPFVVFVNGQDVVVYATDQADAERRADKIRSATPMRHE